MRLIVCCVLYATAIAAAAAEFTFAALGDASYTVEEQRRHRGNCKLLANFTRIEVFGSPVVGWVRGRVRDEKGRLKFEATLGS